MNRKLTPFLKWAGGKRWLTNRYGDIFPSTYGLYIEPFLGGGSVYFYLHPNRGVLGDINEELITTYCSIRDDWRRVEELLVMHQANHSEEYYYRIRDATPVDPVERAARFIYLNRTCFNGIYRVNLQGRFNVPKGTKNTVIFDTDDFRGIAELLATADLRVSDFEILINEASKDDLIFADPPYTATHNHNGFIKYNEKLFSWDDQVRLADSLWRAKNRGAKVLCTNANHQAIRELYEERGFDIRIVSRHSAISADPNRRNHYEEIIASANLGFGGA